MLCFNRHFSYSKKESESKDVSLHFVEFSSLHNSDRRSNATRSKTSRIKMYLFNARSRLFCRIAKRSIINFSIPKDFVVANFCICERHPSNHLFKVAEVNKKRKYPEISYYYDGFRFIIMSCCLFCL